MSIKKTKNVQTIVSLCNPLKNTMQSFKKFIKNVLAALICIIGIPLLVRYWIGLRKKTTILLYHDISPAVFTKHITYLLRHYTLIPLDRLVTAIHNKDISQIPPKSVVITIDDGHAGNIALLPIIEQYNINPTLYVCTQLINTHRHFWFKIPHLPKKEKERLKKLPNTERLINLKETYGFEPTKTYPNRHALNIDEMQEMLQSVDFQPHTQFHPILPNCSDIEAAQEILGSKVDLEQLLNKPCRHFSYPNGDWTHRELAIVKTSSFRSARTTAIGWNTVDTSPYQLKVVPIRDNIGLLQFRAALTTLPQRFGKWINSLL